MKDNENVTLDQLTGEMVEAAAASQDVKTAGEPSAQAPVTEIPAAQEGQQATTKDGLPVEQERVPYTRLKEVEDQFKETKTKLEETLGKLKELENFKTSKQEILNWVDDLVKDTKAGRAVMEAYQKAKMNEADPTMANLPDDDPLKPLMMKLAALESKVGSFERERMETQAQKAAREERERVINKTADEYDEIVTSVSDKAVKGILENDHHMRNILALFQIREDKKTSLKQIATDYVKNMPGIKVNTQTLRNATGPDVWAKGGAAPPQAPKTNGLTLNDDAALAEAAKAAAGMFSS
jgi:hypothetical protein